jgi:LAS superfamily LD-carboxypeptidase LdcB
MADQILKTVRITDNIKVEVLQQGKKRKYVIFYDGNNDYITGRRSGYDDTDKNNNTKSEKYDVAMSDDDVIEMALKAYNGRFGSYSKKFSITQNIYSDPAPARTYGNGDKSPYYLNNGCAINIQWIGKIPNPEFNPGTYSNLNDAEKAGKGSGKPRYLENSTITSTTDNADNSDTLPKSSWSVSPPVIFDDDPFGNSSTGTLVSAGQEVPVDYRDTSYVQDKIVTVTLSKGFTENDGKGYLVWTNHGLQYNTKALPNGTEYQKNVLVDAQGNIVDPEKYDDLTQEDLRKLRPVTVTTSGDIIENFRNDNKDSDIVSRVIEKFKNMVSQLHGISNNDYDLKLCAPDNEACSLIPYKSPLESPVKANDLQTPPGPTPSNANTKIKFTIDGLPTEIILKAKEDLDTFTIWAGPIPKISNGSGNIDDYEDGIGEEYIEGGFTGTEEDLIYQKEEKSFELEGGPEEFNKEVQKAAEVFESEPYVPSGKHNLDLVPGEYVTNSGKKIQLCCIDGKPVNVKIADALLDMIAAAKKDNITITVKSGFRSPYDSISAKSSKGFSVSASSQKYLWDLHKAGKGNVAAPPGSSNHGNGIALDLNAGGTSGARFAKPNRPVYTWLVKNSWKFGFIRAVAKEEWHFDYLPDLAKKGPYGKLPAQDLGRVDTKFYKDWGLDNISIA